MQRKIFSESLSLLLVYASNDMAFRSSVYFSAKNMNYILMFSSLLLHKLDMKIGWIVYTHEIFLVMTSGHKQYYPLFLYVICYISIISNVSCEHHANYIPELVYESIYFMYIFSQVLWANLSFLCRARVTRSPLCNTSPVSAALHTYIYTGKIHHK